MPKHIRRNITLAPEDFDTVRRHAQEWGLSFSAALRLIIREWKHYQKPLSQPEEVEDPTQTLH